MGTDTDGLMFRQIDILLCLYAYGPIAYIFTYMLHIRTSTMIDSSNDNNNDRTFMYTLTRCIYLYRNPESEDRAQPLTLDASWKVHLSPVWYFCRPTADQVYQLWSIVFKYIGCNKLAII